MSYRLKVEERDLSGFVTQTSNQIGAIVLKSRKGTKTPVLCQGEEQVRLNFGEPNQDYFGVFEAIDYSRVAPVWIVSALGSGYKYAGVDVKSNSVESFGTRSGRVYENFNANNYSSVLKNYVYEIPTSGDGKTLNYVGTINTTGVVFPIIATSVKLKVGSKSYDTTVNTQTNTITSSALTGINSFNVADGSFDITFSGASGTVASYLSSVSVSSPIDLSANNTDKGINLTIDGVLYRNINFGKSSSASGSAIVSAINTAVGSTVASLESNFIRIKGLVASSSSGTVKLSPASNLENAIPYIFDSTQATTASIIVSNATNPTNFVPQAGEKISWDFNVTKDIKSETCFSVFAASPFEDTLEQYSVNVTRVQGQTNQFRLVLNKLNSLGTSSELNTYIFSTDKQKNSFGKSLFYEDVFKNDPYIKIFVNSTYVGYCDPISANVVLTGGTRGNEPQASDYVEAWNNFKKKNLYPIKTFMDVYGNSANTLKEIISNYQPYAFGITVVPYGFDVDSAKQFRIDLNMDFDGLALYTNWIKIDDTINNSEVWTSAVGKIGVKYAQMDTNFDGLAPAGTDENGIGGQLNSGFKIIDVERDFTDFELQVLDEAQLNPLIKDNGYGVMVYGQKTLQVRNSDTSYVAHRRMLNYITDNISNQVLKQQIFKLNDPYHRLLAKTQSEILISPVLNAGILRDFYVQCDENNNNDAVLSVRKFILDVYVKVTPFSEFVLLRVTRLPQSAIISELIA